MEDKLDRDMQRAELFVKRAVTGIVSKYEALYTRYSGHERADAVAEEYSKWLAKLLSVLSINDCEERVVVLAQLEELHKNRRFGEEDKTMDLTADHSSGEAVSEAAQGYLESHIIEIILNDGSLFPVYPQDVRRWEELYPAVDVIAQLRKMVGWSEANPKKRKTKTGIKRFINSWLAKEQDRGGSYLPSASYGQDAGGYHGGATYPGGASYAGGAAHPSGAGYPGGAAHLDGTAHPDGGIWMNGKQVLGVKPKMEVKPK